MSLFKSVDVNVIAIVSVIAHVIVAALVNGNAHVGVADTDRDWLAD